MADTPLEDGTPHSATNGAQNFPLLTLPAELVELIIEYIEPCGLLPLRLVSHDVAQRVLQPFLNHYFNRRAFLLSSEDSLRILLAISENEKLARGLKTIDLSVEDIPDPEFDADILRDLNQPTTRSHTVKRKQAMLDGWHMREWHAAYEKQTDNQEQKVDLHLLTVIFSRLRRLGHSVEIRVVDQCEACEKPLGKETLEWLCGEPFHTENSRLLPVPMVLEAIALSALPLESFVIRHRRWDWRLENLTRTPREVTNTHDAFRYLKKLHLMHDRLVSMLPSLGRMKTAFAAVASATMVEDLSLQVRTDKPYRTGMYNEAIRCLCDCLENNFPLLKALDLQGYELSLNQLEGIVARHPQLQTLHFHGGEELHSAYPESGFVEYPPIHADRYMTSDFLENIPLVARFRGRMIARCTVFELAKGKDAFDEDFDRSTFWGGPTWDLV